MTNRWKAAEAEAPPREESLLDDLLEVKPEIEAPRGDVLDRSDSRTLVGECVSADHPTLSGRALVRLAAGEERWFPHLQGLAIRAGDRVLIVFPANQLEGVVVGVVDGFALRPEPRRETTATLTLLPDQKLVVLAANGSEILEVRPSERGPVVRLLGDTAKLEVEGELDLRAAAVRVTARSGPVEVRAQDDVVIRGETIKLN